MPYSLGQDTSSWILNLHRTIDCQDRFEDESQVVSGWQVESMTGTGLTDQETNDDPVSWACLALTDLRIGEIGY